MDNCTNNLEARWNAQGAAINIDENIPRENIVDLENEDEEFYTEYTRVIDDETLPHADDATPEHENGNFDGYVNMEIGIRRGNDAEMQRARVRRRLSDEEGNPIGTSNLNPLLDTRVYEVQYPDGTTEAMSANLIAENIIAQVDEEGHRNLMIDEIIDHRTDSSAIKKENGTFVTPNGVTRKKMTTRGWELLVQWKDGSTDWIALKDLKESFPIELAEYSINNKISDEPAFAWWVKHTLRRRDRVVKRIKSKYWERTHKYGLRIPKSIKEAQEIDAENGDTMWMDAVRLEMKNNRSAFEEYDGNVDELIGYQEITGHIIFDIKLGENFRRKARFVADGHKTETTVSVTYSTVVSRDSVRIMLLIAALNELDLQSADIQNAFITAPNKEKCYIWAGDEFGNEKGKLFIVTKALYGLRSASSSFRAYLAGRLDEMGFKSSNADPDVWLRPAVKADGEEYYEYFLSYVDDILAVGVDAKSILEEVKERFKLKNDEIKPPDTYLGANLAEKEINGTKCWTMTSADYVNAAIKNIEDANKDGRWKMPSKAKTPMASSYVPELDDTPELELKEIRYFQELIGILRWATELGRVDILFEVSLLSQYQAAPRQGHMQQIFHIFGFLKKHPKLTLYLDPTQPMIDPSAFYVDSESFKEIYRDAKDELPQRMPKPRGRSVSTTAFVDASHGANKVTRRSHSGYILFVNRAPIIWFSKKQATVESSTFSSEFIALRSCNEAIVHLRYKLRMFGVPLEGPTRIFCDNESVVKNNTNVESTLNKKHSAIAYHYCRWNVAAGITTVGWIESKENLADAMTKRLAEQVRDYLFGNWTY